MREKNNNQNNKIRQVKRALDDHLSNGKRNAVYATKRVKIWYD